MTITVLFRVVVLLAEKEVDQFGPFSCTEDALENIGSYTPALDIICADQARSIRALPPISNSAGTVRRFEDQAFTYHLIEELEFPRPVGFQYRALRR